VRFLQCLLALLLTQAAAPAEIRINLRGQPPVIVVTGSSILPRLASPNFSAIFQVSVDQDGLPPMAGAYAVEDGALVFTPSFPLQPGLRYRAVYQLSSEKATTTLTIPKPAPVSTTYVEKVYPTAPMIPENQLKFYLHFSAPMSRGEASKRVHLLEESGKQVQLPFLELDEELWDRDYRRLTILFDPGRVKRGLAPNQEVGPPLEEGKRYTLVIDREWPDAAGTPLKEGYRKQLAVGAADRTPLDPKTWMVKTPESGTMNPLIVDVHEPLDSALMLRFIDVTDPKGKLVKGTVSIEREETRWIFTPAQAWTAGEHALEILTTLEDLAGNKIGRAFDVDRFERVEQSVSTDVYTLKFTIR
jgi:hypothetical protein